MNVLRGPERMSCPWCLSLLAARHQEMFKVYTIGEKKPRELPGMIHPQECECGWNEFSPTERPQENV